MSNHDSLLEEIAKYDLESDLNKKFPRIWKRLSSRPNIMPESSPIAILLGGQPGAGKSVATKKVKERLNHNVIVINGDEYRNYHKHYDDFYKLYGKDASKHTGEFAGRMVGMIRDEAIKHGFNVVIEGTFRTVDTPLKELQNFRNHGYETEVIVCTCPKELSWDSTIKRAEELDASGIQPRYVPKEHHDLVVSKLSENTSIIFNSGLVSRLEIYSREEKLFDSLNGNIDDIQRIINEELNKLSLGQHNKIDTTRLFMDKLSSISQLDNVEPISAKQLLQVDLDLSQTQKLIQTRKFKR